MIYLANKKEGGETSKTSTRAQDIRVPQEYPHPINATDLKLRCQHELYDLEPNYFSHCFMVIIFLGLEDLLMLLHHCIPAHLETQMKTRVVR